MTASQRKSLSLVYRLRNRTPTVAPGSRPPLLLLLHGVGANELAMASLAGSFDPRFLVISARAPITLAPFSFAWLNVTFTPHGPVIDGDELRAAWIGLSTFIDEAVAAYDVDPAKVFLAGFSQGGILALATILTGPERVAGVVCMSGRLPPEALPHVVPPDRLRGKHVLIVHGTRDDTLEVAYARSANETLLALPLDLQYLELDMGHTTTDASLGKVSDWLTAQLDR